MSGVIDLSDGFSGDEEVMVEKHAESELEQVDKQLQEVKTRPKSKSYPRGARYMNINEALLAPARPSSWNSIPFFLLPVRPNDHT
jgi:hypothetical protein